MAASAKATVNIGTAPVSKGTVKVAFNNTPQAHDDHLTLDITKASQFLDILGNDGGGNAATLWSVGGDTFNQDWLLDNTHTTATSQYGATIRIDGNGVDYVIDSDALAAKVQALAEGETLVDSFTYAIRLANGTLSWATTYVTITGVNDEATISGTVSGIAVEDGDDASGTLTVSDLDHDQSAFAAGFDGTAQYGTFSFDAATGQWSYAVTDHSLAQGEEKEETFTVHSVDGTAQTITITVQGSNDEATIDGTSTASVTEDSGNYTVGGTLTVTDLDAGENKFATPAGLAGTYGNFSFNADTGEWSYTLNNASVDALNTGDTRIDKLTVESLDGTASQDIVVTINGHTDNLPPVGVGEVILASTSTDVKIPVWTLLLNDSDPEGGTLTFGGVTGSGNGTDPSHTSPSNAFNSAPTYNSMTGTIEFSTVGNNVGWFTYTILDAQGASTTATATVYSTNALGGGAQDTSVGAILTTKNLSDYDISYLDAGNNNDSLEGGAKIDFLLGGKGNDILIGDAGKDVLQGDAGDDTLTGGADADIFVFSGAFGQDRVTDFNYAEGDRLDIDGAFNAANLSYSDGNAIYTVSSGNTITLEGITSGVTAAWFV